MAAFVVHTIASSPFGRAVVATLIEKGAEYSVAPVAPGTTRAEPHLALHPFGKVPVLDHGGFRLYETQAILRYIDRVLAEPVLTPTDARQAARMDQVMSISDWYLYHGVNNVIGFQRLIAPRIFGTPPDEAAIAAAMPAAHRVVDTLDRLLADHPFFAGNSISLADLIVAPQLYTLASVPEWSVLSAGRPRLVAWLERVAGRPSLRAVNGEAGVGSS